MVKRAVAQGVVLYLLKPFTFPTFRAKLEQYAAYRAQLATASEQVAQAIDAAERRVRSAVPIARVIYLEPDLLRPSKERGERTASTPFAKGYFTMLDEQEIVPG